MDSALLPFYVLRRAAMNFGCWSDGFSFVRRFTVQLSWGRLLQSGGHLSTLQNAEIFPVQMVAWALMPSVSSGCEMKT